MHVVRRFLALLALSSCAHAATIACVTTPGTYTWSTGASWIGGVAPGSGDRATCATSGVIEQVTGSITIGDSPATGTAVVTFTGGSILAFGQNATLTALGGVTAPIRKAAGATLLFDSSSAASPTATPYILTANTFTDDGTHPAANTPGNQFTITANNATGTNWRWTIATAGSGTTGLVNSVVQFCGDPAGAAPCLLYTPGGSGVMQIGMTGATPTPPTLCTTTCAPVTFDHTCGIKWNTSGMTSNDGYNLDVTFKNNYSGSSCAPFVFSNGNVPNGGVVRTATNMVFVDALPTIQSTGSTWNYPVFFKGFTAGVFTGVGQMNYPWINNTTASGQQIGTWNITGGFIFSDFLDAASGGVIVQPTPFKSGTITSATTSSMTDSAASFPSTMFNNSNPTQAYGVVFVTGAASGQAMPIRSITGTTVINSTYNWPVTPSAGDTYRVYNPNGNPHYTQISAVAANVFYEHTIGWYLGFDFAGDFWHSANTNGVTYNFDYTTVLPNIARGNTGTLGTLGVPAAGGTIAYNITHSTYFTGEQAISLCEGCGPDIAGKVHKFESQILWDDPARPYVHSTTVGPWGADISQGTPATNLANQIAMNCNYGAGSESCANFNFGYGIVPNSASTAANGYCSTVVTGCNKKYNVNSTVIMGAHDVDNIDPGFPNRWANPISWGYSLGCTNSGDPFQDMACVWNQIISINDPSGHTAGFNLVAFYNYIGTNLAPTNIAYHNTAADGTDVGAWPYAGSIPTPVSIALTPNPFSVAVASTQALVCTTTLSDSSTRNCISPVLLSSDATKASVAGLVVTGVAPGTGTITATAESLTSPTDAFTVTGPFANIRVIGNAKFSGAAIIQ